MTQPTITYGHGLLESCTDYSSYNRTDSTDALTDADMIVIYGGWFRCKGTCDSAADEWAYWEKDISNITTNMYPQYVLRWKTQVASSGLGARVELAFTSGSQWILGESAPQFSTTWAVEAGTVTPDKTLDKIRFVADDYPDSVASGTYEVYYDFLLLSEKFSFPHVGERGGVQVTMSTRCVDIPVPGRGGDVTQNLGSESATIRVEGDMELGSWGTPKGQHFYEVIHEIFEEPYQWFTCDEPKINCTVTPRTFTPVYEGGRDGKPRYVLELKEYRLVDANYERYSERYGI